MVAGVRSPLPAGKPPGSSWGKQSAPAGAIQLGSRKPKPMCRPSGTDLSHPNFRWLTRLALASRTGYPCFIPSGILRSINVH